MKESMSDDIGGFSSSLRKGSGRKKIPMKKIEKKTSVQVTFSKRRSGLFKKAQELCLLCGAEVAVITFSPGGKPFLFGNPSADAVIGRLNDSGGPVPGGRVLGRETLERPEVERGDTAGGNRRGFWWEAPESEIERMGLTELELFGGALQEFMNKGALRMMMENGSDNAAGSNFNHPGTSSTVESANSASLVLQDFKTKMEAPPECNSLCLDYTSDWGFCFDETLPCTKIFF